MTGQGSEVIMRLNEGGGGEELRRGVVVKGGREGAKGLDGKRKEEDKAIDKKSDLMEKRMCC